MNDGYVIYDELDDEKTWTMKPRLSEDKMSGVVSNPTPPVDEMKKSFSTKIYKAYRSYVHIALLLLGSMFYKFAFEGISTSVSLLCLIRLPSSFAVTLMGISNVLFSVFQSLGSSVVGNIVMYLRASFVLGSAIVLYGLAMSLILFLELFTGGSFWTSKGIVRGAYSLPFFTLVVHCFGGFCHGIIEVLRVFIPPLIFPGREDMLQRVNSVAHICFSVAGAAGAFASAGFVRVVGDVYSLTHIPLCFLLSGCCMFFIIHDFKSKRLTKSDLPVVSMSDVKSARDGKRKKSAKKSLIRTVINSVKQYMKTVWKGFTIIAFDKKYSFLLVCFVVPEVVKEIKDNILFPTYANEVIRQSYVYGMFLGSSNFGELVGALVVLICSYVPIMTSRTTPLNFANIGAVTLNFLWLYPYIQWNRIDSSSFFSIEIILLIINVLVAAGFSAGEVSLLSYLQKIPKESDRAAGMSFIYLFYVLCIAFSALLFGNLLDIFNSRGLLRWGLTMLVIVISVASVIVMGFSCLGYLNIKSDKRKQAEDVYVPTPLIVLILFLLLLSVALSMFLLSYFINVTFTPATPVCSQVPNFNGCYRFNSETHLVPIMKNASSPTDCISQDLFNSTDQFVFTKAKECFFPPLDMHDRYKVEEWECSLFCSRPKVRCGDKTGTFFSLFGLVEQCVGSTGDVIS